jgi:hypothetical protein
MQPFDPSIYAIGFTKKLRRKRMRAYFPERQLQPFDGSA